MKKFLLYILTFLLILSAFDYIWGLSMQYLFRHCTGGQTYCQYYTAYKATEDVIMMGSSRMRHHYNPSIIEDSLNMTCYNAGEDGSGILFNYGLYKLLTQRYTPKIIIYDLYTFDIHKDDNIKYLGWLRKFYNEPIIKEIISTIDPEERIKCISSMYRYNTRCIEILGDYIHPIRTYEKGYSPMTGIMDYTPSPYQYQPQEVDSIKLHYLDCLIDDCKENNILLVFIASPQYGVPEKNGFYDVVRNHFAEKDVIFLDMFHTQCIIDKVYFSDQHHLNNDGADKFSKIIAGKILDIINAQ